MKRKRSKRSFKRVERSERSEASELNGTSEAKKILSFDVGVRNLGICVISSGTDREISICHWEVCNLFQEPKAFKCSVEIVSGKNKGTVCRKKAKFCVDSKSKTENEIETETEAGVFLYCCAQHSKTKDFSNSIKKEIPEKKNKVKNLSIQRMCELALSALNELVLNEQVKDVSEVLIELQPKFNPKMKLLSHFIYSYFMIKGINDKLIVNLTSVKFVSAKYKLRDVDIQSLKLCSLKNKYNQRKFYSIEYTKKLLEEKEDNFNLTKLLESPKKDDLCDAFLQGLWYLKKLSVSKPEPSFSFETSFEARTKGS